MSKTKEKRDRHRTPRVAVQLPEEAAEIGKKLARMNGKTFGRWLADLIVGKRKPPPKQG